MLNRKLFFNKIWQSAKCLLETGPGIKVLTKEVLPHYPNQILEKNTLAN